MPWSWKDEMAFQADRKAAKNKKRLKKLKRQIKALKQERGNARP